MPEGASSMYFALGQFKRRHQRYSPYPIASIVSTCQAWSASYAHLIPWLAGVYETQISAKSDHVAWVVVQRRGMDLVIVNRLFIPEHGYTYREGCVQYNVSSFIRSY